MKQAEDGDFCIIRFHELSGNAQDSVSVTFPADILFAEETNGLEETIGDASFSGRTLSFSIGAFGIKTFAFRLAAPDGAVDVPTRIDTTFVHPIALTYNADMMSLNANRSDGLSTLGSLFPGELLPDTLIADGVSFLIGPRTAGKKNVVQCKGQEIALPGTDSSVQTSDSITLHMLAFSILQEGEELTLQTDDGAECKFSVDYVKGNIADWGSFYSTSVLRSADIAFAATHSHETSGRKDVAYDFMYLFHYKVCLPSSCKTITLPAQQRTFIVALTQVDNSFDPLTPLISPDILFPTAKEVPVDVASCGQRLVPTSVTASGYSSSDELPKYAADFDSYTKWSDSKSGGKWLLYTFAEDVSVCQWEILFAGIDGDSKIASAFTLQYYDAETKRFVDCDKVTGNTENHLLRGIKPVTSKRFRLQLDSPTQSGSGTASVCQLNLFGSDTPSPDGIQPVFFSADDGQLPVFDVSGRKIGIATVSKGLLHLTPLPEGIYIVGNRKVRVR